MHPIMLHIVFPSIMPALFFTVAAIPVEMIGCRTRGLLALAVAFVSMLAGVAAAVMAVRGKAKDDPESSWWVMTALILAVPGVALLVLA
jgi:uncharacterized membrane protein YhaH (DUF805 family)